MRTKKLEYPDNTRTCWFTFKGFHYSGPYGGVETPTILRKRGFYSKLFGNIAIPPDWQFFNNILLPHGWGGYRLQIEDIISWEYCTDEELYRGSALEKHRLELEESLINSQENG